MISSMHLALNLRIFFSKINLILIFKANFIIDSYKYNIYNIIILSVTKVKLCFLRKILNSNYNIKERKRGKMGEGKKDKIGHKIYNFSFPI